MSLQILNKMDYAWPVIDIGWCIISEKMHDSYLCIWFQNKKGFKRNEFGNIFVLCWKPGENKFSEKLLCDKNKLVIRKSVCGNDLHKKYGSESCKNGIMTSLDG